MGAEAFLHNIKRIKCFPPADLYTLRPIRDNIPREYNGQTDFSPFFREVGSR